MSQSSAIAAALIVGFVVFITVRGELPAYLAVFTGQAPANSQQPGRVKSSSGFNFTIPGITDINVSGPSAPERPEEFPGYNPGFNFWDLNDPSNPFFKGF